jgi:hypothetical protein
MRTSRRINRRAQGLSCEGLSAPVAVLTLFIRTNFEVPDQVRQEPQWESCADRNYCPLWKSSRWDEPLKKEQRWNSRQCQPSGKAKAALPSRDFGEQIFSDSHAHP